MGFARLIEAAAPVLLVAGIVFYGVLLGLAVFANWMLPWPQSTWWLLASAMPASGVAIMFLRARAHRVSVQGEEE